MNPVEVDREDKRAIVKQTLMPFSITNLSFVACMLALVGDSGVAPGHSNAQKPIAEMNFEIVNGRIYIPGLINGHRISFVLDSGANPGVIDLELAKRWGLTTIGEVSVDGSGTKEVYGKALDHAKGVIGGIDFPVTFAIPLSVLNAREGRKIQAIVGYPLLRNHIVEIDYGTRHLKIFGPKVSPEPLGIKIPFHIVEKLPHVMMDLDIGGSKYKVEALIDTGATSSSLTSKFQIKHPIQVSTTPRMISGGGLGGVNYGRLFRTNSIKIGPFVLEKPWVSTTDSKTGALGTNSTFEFLAGYEILSRFTVTFDYPNNQIYLDPNVTLFDPFEADKSGLNLFSEAADLHVYRVIEVIPGSAAAAAGVKHGDVIESIDGKPASGYSLFQLRQLLRSPTSAQWSLGINRRGQHLEVIVKAKSII